MKFSPLLKLNVYLLALAICIILAPTFSRAASSTLVIDEFMIAGKDAYDEYLLVANYGASSRDLNGYKVMKYTAAGNPEPIYTFASFYLNAGAKVMICSGSFRGERLPDTFTYSSNTMAANNSVALLDNKGVLIDLVGHGGDAEKPVTLFEGAAIISSPSPYQVLARRNGVDSENNKMDFQLVTKPVVVDLNADKLVISELLPNPETGSEWFELYNPTNLDVSLANLKICDSLGARHCYFFDKADVLLGNSYKIYGQPTTKITLNNDGDWLELYDTADNLLTDSGGDYGAADKGISLSLFGSEYRWTRTLTPGAQNVFTDTIEVEIDPVTKAKTSKSKVVTATKKTVVAANSAGTSSDAVQNAEADVKAAQTESPIAAIQKALVDHKTLGWALIGLAILLVVGYTLWYFRSYAKDIYDKIRHRDDSARF